MRLMIQRSYWDDTWKLIPKHQKQHMASKFKKGYYVNGKFVAEDSEIDLELKREMKGRYETSRTDDKRESEALQALGESLTTLSNDQLQALGLNEKLLDALNEVHRITNFEGRRRHMQFIGKLMRKLEPEEVERAKTAILNKTTGSAAEKMALHVAERWRDDLIANDDAFERWIGIRPQTDTQQLRALIRQARKDQDAMVKAPAGTAHRQGRAYREIFLLVREGLEVADRDAEEN
jgi:ribosome-associated protein